MCCNECAGKMPKTFKRREEESVESAGKVPTIFEKRAEEYIEMIVLVSCPKFSRKA